MWALVQRAWLGVTVTPLGTSRVAAVLAGLPASAERGAAPA